MGIALNSLPIEGSLPLSLLNLFEDYKILPLSMIKIDNFHSLFIYPLHLRLTNHKPQGRILSQSVMILDLLGSPSTCRGNRNDPVSQEPHYGEIHTLSSNNSLRIAGFNSIWGQIRSISFFLALLR